MQQRIAEFQKEHKRFKKGTIGAKEMSKVALKFFVEIAPYLAVIDIVVVVLGAGAFLGPFFGALAGAGAVGLVTKLFGKVTHMSEASDLIERLSDIGDKLTEIAREPDFEQMVANVPPQIKQKFAAAMI
jgi:uncharacterized membrane protein required for colicin V production|tara:strand:+ start:1049 stop:1435 length:387 start_codon:yes stop_codon:yes gene_type:complete